MNIRRRFTSTTALAGATALGLVSLSACSDAGAAAGGGRMKVVASFYPMEFLAEEIGGEHVSVSSLTEPGVEPHDLELSPRQTAELSEAGLVVHLKGMQPAVDEAVAQSGVEHVADAAAFAGAEEHGAKEDHGDGHGAKEDHGDEHGAKEDHGDEQGEKHADGHGEEHADEHGHEHGGASDPHIWLDPLRYAEAAEGVGKALQKADPDHADAYRKNTDDLVGRLKALDGEFDKGLKGRATDTFITNHAAFGHLAHRYGLKEEAISGLDPESEPTPARMKELQEIAEREKVGTVFFETLVSDKTAKTLAADTGLKTAVLDPVEGITDASRGDDYLEVMRANLAALRTALGAR